MDTEYHTYSIGDRVMTNHSVGTGKDCEFDGNDLGGMVDRVVRQRLRYVEEDAKVGPLLALLTLMWMPRLPWRPIVPVQ
jgi:hypothetical protein